MTFRRKSTLSYDHAGAPAGLQGVARTVADQACCITWGSPTPSTWRDACQASLAASRARRAGRRK